ncbi:MAG: CoA-binding protein, partial [Desulfobacterales bacterium]|nr:CoA-binding protein [Desulfobacterales bacterium]
MSQDLRPFFYPRHVAVIGASENPRKIGHEILKNIQAGGFSGNIYPVNPTSSQILGIPCYAGIDRIPGPVDLAVVVIPAGRVPQAIAECGKKGVPAAVIITGGFSEASASGEALQKQTVEAAKRHGVRLIGPNCQGLNNPHASLCASWPL